MLVKWTNISQKPSKRRKPKGEQHGQQSPVDQVTTFADSHPGLHYSRPSDYVLQSEALANTAPGTGWFWETSISYIVHFYFVSSVSPPAVPTPATR